ncbi:MAG: hypothetical protein ACPGXX_05040, partial [Planctomycetaceae bacterium]
MSVCSVARFITIASLVTRLTAGLLAQDTVSAPPAAMKLPEFYAKYLSADGYPIVASATVNDYALKEAAFLIRKMLAQRPDVREAMIAGGS